MKVKGLLRIDNFGCGNPVEFSNMTVRVVDSVAWYYGANRSYERAVETISGLSNAFIIKFSEMVNKELTYAEVDCELTVNNWGCENPEKYPYISVRVVDNELWYYGGDPTYERAKETISGLSNAFIFKYSELI